MKYPHLLLLLCCAATAAFSQSIAPEVIASGGNSDHVQLNWTIGEVVINTYDNGTNIITQGFHQTLLVLPPDPVSVSETSGTDIRVYPNPTSERIIIALAENELGLQAELYDMNGQLITKETIGRGQLKKELNMGTLAAATYLLHLRSQQNNFSINYKIQKTQ